MAIDDQLQALLASVQLMDVRLICFKTSAGWRVKRLYAVPLEATPTVPERVEYPTHLFLRAAQPVSEFLTLLEALQVDDSRPSFQATELTHLHLFLGPAIHYQGYVRWGLDTYTVPTWHYSGNWSAPASSTEYEQVSEPLIGADSPYFPRVTDGEAWFLLERGVYRQQDTIPEIAITIPDQRAYFTGVDISGDTYTVRCEGALLHQCLLQLYTSTPQVERKLAERENTLVITGEPEKISLALTYESGWLDRRDIGSGMAERWNADDVHHVDAVDTVLSIKELVTRHGESMTLEFKANAGEKGKPAEKNRFLQSVVAFANTNGGTILVGVDDDGTVVGTNELDTKERIRDLIEDSIRAVPDVETLTTDLDGKPVLVVRVVAGAEKPYALMCGTNKPRYYMRRDASNKPAKPEDFRSMLPPNSTALDRL